MSREQSALLLLVLSIGLTLAVDICEYQRNGAHLLHPADCSKFVECQNGKTDRILSCPLGLHFNRFEGVCDLRQRAFCDLELVNFMKQETNCSACCAHYGCYVNPECPETPAQSTTSSAPVSDTTAESTHTPATLSTTNLPVTSGAPDNSDEPVKPPASTTKTPNTSGTPASPATPTTSGTPVSPATPTTSGTPVSSATPTTSGTPASPATPTTSGTPVSPATPTTSGTPASPATPTTSGTPASPATPTTSGTPVSPATPTTSGTPVSPVTPNTPGTPPANKCANNLTVCQRESDNSVMHVNGSCNRYIVCVAGCAYIMSCPANLQYDIAKQECDYPENVDCPWQATTAITGPSGISCEQHGQCENQPNGKLFARPNSDGYIICQCECEIEKACPQGTKFHAKLLTCAWKVNEMESEGFREHDDGYADESPTQYENADGSENDISAVCRTDMEICKNQTEGTLIPADGLCNKFYKCNYGCAVEILCPNDLVYNPHTEYCDYSYNYKCPWSFTPSSLGPSACPAGVACASRGRCEGKLDGTLFPSLTSCAKYVVCQCECEAEKDCAQNLFWDENLLTCTYSANITCHLD